MLGCMQNLVDQTLFKDGQLEIIVIDSCSEQNEKDIVERYQAQYDNITYIRTDSRETLYASWNRGIQLARGRYITNANTDDRHREDALEKLANYLDDYPDIALTYPGQIDTSVPNETFASTSSTKIMDWPVYSYQELERHCIIGSQPMWRKSLHTKYGLFRDTFEAAGDYEFWLRVGKSEPFFRYPEVLGLYYRNPEGIEHGSDISKKEAIQVWQEYGMFDRGIPVILNGRVLTSPELTTKSTEPQSLSTRKTFDIYINGFEAHLLKNEFEQALEVAQAAVNDYNELPYAHILQAIAYRQLQRYNEALFTLEQSIQLEETPEALIELIQLSISTGNFEEASKTETYLIGKYPEWKDRLSGIEYPQNNETSTHDQSVSEKDEEVDIIRHVHKTNLSDNITIQLNNSVTPDPLDKPASIEDLDYTLKSFNELRSEFEQLVKLSDVQHAEKLALAATRKFPENSEAWVLKATSHRLKGAYQEAKEAIQRSLLIKDSPEALIELLELSLSIGEATEAKKIADVIKNSYPALESHISGLLSTRLNTSNAKAVTLNPAIQNFMPLRPESRAQLLPEDYCLVSYPGSGSSWLSNLLADILQQARGFETKRAQLSVPPMEIITDLHESSTPSTWLQENGIYTTHF